MSNPEMREKLAALAAEGLTFGMAVDYFYSDVEQIALRHYVNQAEEHHLVSDGQLEIANPGCVSKGDDSGAYVMCWLWVEDQEQDDE